MRARQMMRLITAACLSGLLLAGMGAHAQATFDVASVKANTSGASQITVNWDGAVTIINVPLRAIVQYAYGINTPSRISGYPAWTDVERFDILAKPPAGMTGVEEMRAMLRTLLADRFRLLARLETRQMQGYALVRSRADGRLGPNLTPSKTACVGPRGEANPLAMQCATPGTAGATRFVGVPMAQLAAMLSLIVGRPVTDRTQITGPYDFELKFSADAGAGGAADTTAPSIFTALPEQLGLKLDTHREEVEVLVIERIERPSQN